MIATQNFEILTYQLLFVALQDNPLMTCEGLHFCRYHWILQGMRRSSFCWAMSKLALSLQESRVNLLEAFQREGIGAFASEMPFRKRCAFLVKKCILFYAKQWQIGHLYCKGTLDTANKYHYLPPGVCANMVPPGVVPKSVGISCS